ncbi:MAG: PKD domain-containing protein, partial [Acidobacteriota bacterium]
DLHKEPGSPGSNIYYHYGLDVGGSEGQTVIRSAVDGLVLSAGDVTLVDYRENTPVAPRYDVIYILDSRGWLYRHSHFYSIDSKISPGLRVRKGQELGILGKEGGSGGWSHFHFDINRRQPSGRFGSEDAYAFYWQSYFAKYPYRVQAVARPHKLVQAGEEIILDGSRSRSFPDNKSGLLYKWLFSDGSVSNSMAACKKYNIPGYYSEILQVTDSSGNIDYDFCPVYVIDPGKSIQEQPHTIHAVFHPTVDIKAGEDITFKVRSFGIDPLDGKEVWNFGDGSPEVEVCSDGNAEQHSPEGYAVTRHTYNKPGHYLDSVSRISNRDHTATARLEVVVGK